MDMSSSQKQTPLPITLFLGGTRSGKSGLAEEFAAACIASRALPENAVLYVATAEACDTSMQNRIERHQARRPKAWQTAEIPVKLAENLEIFLRDMDRMPSVILVDCVTLWLTNILFALEKDIADNDMTRLDAQTFEDACLAEINDFFRLVAKYPNMEWILVSGETGLGGIGASKLERLFQDGLGLVNQRIAEVARQRFFCVAGCALPLDIERPWH